MQRNLNQDVLIYGKIPPQAVDIEQAVLSAILNDKDCLIEVLDIVTPECFYDDRNKTIFTAIVSLFAQSKPIDLYTTTNELRRLEKLEESGGAFYITQLFGKMASSAHVQHHAKILQEKAIARGIIEVGISIANEGYEDSTDVFELVSRAERDIEKATNILHKGTIKNAEQLTTETLKEIDKASKNADSVTGVYSGYENLDRVTGGWQNSDLIIIAARPSMGKSAFMGCLARNASVDFDVPVAIFSLEMSDTQLMKRLMAVQSDIPLDRLLRGSLTDQEMLENNRGASVISQSKIFIDDTASLSIFDLRAKAKRLKYEHGIGLLIVDYIQLMTPSEGKNRSRENEVSEISRGLKILAKELEIPVIALSQLSRSVESRSDKRPMLSDLRESGAIEQDADVVCFLYRPEYYKIEVDENGNSTHGKVEIIIAKHRNGALDTINLNFIGSLTKFTNYSEIRIPKMKPVKSFYESGDKDTPF